MTQDTNDIPSPCVRNCCLNLDDICLGCGRSLDEITGWARKDNNQKLATLATSEQRLKTLKN